MRKDSFFPSDQPLRPSEPRRLEQTAPEAPRMPQGTPSTSFVGEIYVGSHPLSPRAKAYLGRLPITEQRAIVAEWKSDVDPTPQDLKRY